MRILIIANSTVGLVKFRKELIERLSRDNKVYIATKCDECMDELTKLDVEKIEPLEMNRRGIDVFQEISLIHQIKLIIKRHKPQLIITYTVKPNIYAGLIARLYNIPYATNITGLGTAFQKENWLKKTIIFLYRIALKKANVVFFENDGNKKVFIENKVVKEEKCFVLNGAGVNIEEFELKPFPKEKDKVFIYMGRVMHEKGIDELFEAMEMLHRKYPDSRLLVLGDYEEKYENKVNQLVENNVIEYVGWVQDVKPYIEQAMCTILPSYHEGMSNTLLECAAMGRPIITSNIPGCRETVENQISGFLVEVKNSLDLYEKMVQFYELPYEKKIQMGLAARKHVENFFDKKQVVDNTINRMEIK